MTKVEIVLIVLGACSNAYCLRNELQGYINRAVIWLKIRAPVSRFNRLLGNQQVIYNTIAEVKKEAEKHHEARVAGYGAVLEKVALTHALIQEVSSRTPASHAGGLEELLLIKMSLAELVAKLNSPEAEQLNATYMQSLGQLAKAADATLGKQEKIEKLLELIVIKLNERN